MKKVVDFLEQNVQWVALGLGGLYLAYMIWAYILGTPVMVSGIAPHPLAPGEVDPYIDSGPAAELEKDMKNTFVPPMLVPHFVAQFQADMAFSTAKPQGLAMLFDGSGQKVQLLGTDAIVPLPNAPAPTALAVLPSAEVTNLSTGKSNVQLPGAPAPAAAAIPAAGPGGAAAAPVAATGTDKTWVTVGFKVSAQALSQAFKAANVPNWCPTTTFLQVQLYREEALPGGAWSDPKLIPPIEGQVTLDFPDAGNRQGEGNYLVWAQNHVPDILQPPFLPVVKGDPWRVPGQAVVAAAPVQLVPLDPTKEYSTRDLNAYPPDQRKAYYQQHQAYLNSQKANRPQRQPRNPGGGRSSPPGGFPPGGPGGPGPGGPGASGNPSRLSDDVFAQVDRRNPSAPPGSMPPMLPDALPPGSMPPGSMPPGSMPPGTMPPGMPPQPNPNDAAAAAAAAAAFAIPPAIFDPTQLAADISGWAHDDTVAPGRQYRYLIVYRLKNPIYGTNAAKNPKLTGQFDLISSLKDAPEKAWSQPVDIVNDTSFFVFANSGPQSRKARIKVFKWQNGMERAQIFEPGPGDIIGGKDGDVDYSTGWTVVDLRDDPHRPGKTIVLVMDPTGRLERRDYDTDQAKKELETLNSQVSAASSTDQLAGGK